MRIAFSGTGFVGHLVPMVPLMQAAVAAGHDVAVITSGELEGFLRREASEALTVLPAGPLAGETMRRMDAELGLSPASDPVPPVIAEFFAGRLVDAGVHEALRNAEAWGPDLVVGETMDHIGPFVAAAVDAPFVRHTFGPTRPRPLTDALRVVAERRARLLALPMAEPVAIVDVFPAALQPDAPTPAVPVLPIRPEIHGGGGPGPAPAPAAPGTRRALVTFGTVFTDPGLRDRAADSFDADRWDLVVTTGAERRPPSAARSRAYVAFTPLGDLLPGTDVLVTAGGAGTVLAGLRAGVPMVVVPQGADHEINAARAEQAGVAVVVRDAADVGPAADRIAGDPAIRERARRIAAEIALLPPAPAVLAQLERRAAARVR
ncbi:glycosyltransferase [Amnibacterium setariae]|uniref:Glycosyltransferase n=1 Tax=Amnibacterium setariae TaxID=2306585 RepID=A0A3A1TXP5_9MICO|nr:glycosyltransferase [Amnibacterium setariae]RIX28589.1 glycosyltransferase [Amnibacterium setariae]